MTNDGGRPCSKTPLLPRKVLAGQGSCDSDRAWRVLLLSPGASLFVGLSYIPAFMASLMPCVLFWVSSSVTLT